MGDIQSTADLFKDRKDAGEQLARKLEAYAGEDAVVLAAVDARKYIVPGLGDFGDRYFGF